MAVLIAPTPVLEGEDALEFLMSNADTEKRVPLVPTPNLDKIREKMLDDDRRKKESV